MRCHRPVQPVVVISEADVSVRVVATHEEAVLVFVPRDGRVGVSVDCQTEPGTGGRLHVLSTRTTKRMGDYQAKYLILNKYIGYAIKNDKKYVGYCKGERKTQNHIFYLNNELDCHDDDEPLQLNSHVFTVAKGSSK